MMVVGMKVVRLDREAFGLRSACLKTLLKCKTIRITNMLWRSDVRLHAGFIIFG